MPKISAVLITKNEEKRLPACLESLRWVDEIVIVDSGSTDGTLACARRFTDKIYTAPFVNYSAQKNQAMAYAQGDWILVIDADERVSDDLASRIRGILRDGGPEKAYAIKRVTFHFGRRFRFSGTQDDYPVRLFPRGKGRYVQPVHEKLETALPVARIEAPLWHDSSADLTQYFEKFHHYLRLEKEWLVERKRRVHFWDLILRPLWRFFYLYFLKGGFLDLYPGFLYSVLSAYYDYCKFRNSYHAPR
ncbi:MAG: glycosyltransferase family 2 protein [Candidatus Omnitrophota bacterium]